MSDPVLQREAEVPRTRSTGGAIVVAVAFFSLFTALGASAFVIRVRASAARYVLEVERTAVADDWLATQLARLDRELAARDCGAVNERIERISRLVPDRHLPSRMACR